MGIGLVHVYTGNGKGKTTAAIGLGIRALGRGLRVLMIQFLKDTETGELVVLKKFEPNFLIKRGTPNSKYTWNMNKVEKSQAKTAVQELFQYAVEASKSGNWEMIILDEIMGAIKSDLIDIEDVAMFVKNKPQKLEVVLTGRDTPKEITDIADYVSEINPIKHPFENGIVARIGIEY